MQQQPWLDQSWLVNDWVSYPQTAIHRTLPRLLPHQEPPADPWRLWLLLGGRGSGKTFAGARWLISNRPPQARLGIVAPTAGDARDVCLEGPAGVIQLLEALGGGFRYSRTLGEVQLHDGCRIKAYSADEPNRLRGPQHHRVWLDEAAAFRRDEAVDHALMGLRLGTNPQACFTTTPRPTKLVRRLVDEATLKRATTFDNPYLPDAFRIEILNRYQGTRLGRQELEALILDDVPGALWTRSGLEQTRVTSLPELTHIFVGVDPSTTASGDAWGIVVVGKGGPDDHGYVLADCTLTGSPLHCAAEAVAAYHRFEADLIVAESNQGGEMVQTVFQTIEDSPPVRLVHASRGKLTRAEPIAALSEQGRFHLCGSFAALEDELCGYDGTPPSPNRLDAMVWAATELHIGGGRGMHIWHPPI